MVPPYESQLYLAHDFEIALPSPPPLSLYSFALYTIYLTQARLSLCILVRVVCKVENYAFLIAHGFLPGINHPSETLRMCNSHLFSIKSRISSYHELFTL